MPTFRSLILAFLLLSMTIIGAELTLRAQFERRSAELGVCPQFEGWTPCDQCFLRPPASQSVWSRTESGKAHEIQFDKYGYRVKTARASKTSPEIVVLGSDRVLASEMPWNQTFAAALEQSAAAGVSPGVLNGGVPVGCPLLWELQFESRVAPVTPRKVFLVIGPEILNNDFVIRRATAFDPDGNPTICTHPVSGKKEPTKVDTYFDSFALLRFGVPWLGSQIWQQIPPAGLDSTSQQETTNAISSSIAEALKPIASLNEKSQNQSAELIVGYLPHQNELAAGSSPIHGLKSSLLKYCSEHQIRFLDLSESLASTESAPSSFLPDGVRLSASGHERLAKVIREHLQSVRSAATPQNSIIR